MIYLWWLNGEWEGEQQIVFWKKLGTIKYFESSHWIKKVMSFSLNWENAQRYHYKLAKLDALSRFCFYRNSQIKLILPKS